MLTHASCHVWLVQVAQRADTERTDGTTTPDLSRAYRSAKAVVEGAFVQAFVPYAPGPVASEARECLQRNYVHLGGPVWAPNPTGEQAGWIAFSTGAIVLFMTIGARASLVGSGRACRRAVRRRWDWDRLPSPWQHRMSLVSGVSAVAAFVLAAPAAAAIAWYLLVDLTWPRLVQGSQSYPSVLGAGLATIVCVGVSLTFGSVAARLSALGLRRAARRERVDRCSACGYETGGVALHVCPECGQDPGRRANWGAIRRVRITMPWRVVAYAALLACVAFGASVSMLGPPDVAAWCRTAVGRRPQLLMPAYYLASGGAAPLMWRSRAEPVILAWPTGTAIIQEQVEELAPPVGGAGAAPVRISQAWAWCPSTSDRADPGSWQFGSRSAVSPDGVRAATWRVEFDQGCSLYRLYTVYAGGVSEAYVSGWPTELRPIVPQDGLGVQLKCLSDSLTQSSRAVTRAAGLQTGPHH